MLPFLHKIQISLFWKGPIHIVSLKPKHMFLTFSCVRICHWPVVFLSLTSSLKLSFLLPFFFDYFFQSDWQWLITSNQIEFKEPCTSMLSPLKKCKLFKGRKKILTHLDAVPYPDSLNTGTGPGGLQATSKHLLRSPEVRRTERTESSHNWQGLRQEDKYLAGLNTHFCPNAYLVDCHRK